MIITTTDPITGEDIRNPEFKPFVIEGRGHLAIKIYFESEETRRQYLDIAARESSNGSYHSKITPSRNTKIFFRYPHCRGRKLKYAVSPMRKSMRVWNTI